jgi:hypothetical protein
VGAIPVDTSTALAMLVILLLAVVALLLIWTT